MSFKEALPVPEPALLVGENLYLAALQVHRLHAGDHLAHLGAVRPDILHGACPHRARDQRQVLQSRVTPAHAMFNQCVPLHAGAHLYLDLLLVFRDRLHLLHRRFYHQAIEIFREKKVVTAPQEQFLLVRVGTDNLD